MLIYFALIIFVLVVPYFTRLFFKEKAKNITLCLSLLGIWSVMVLRSPTVGRDIPGYLSLYEQMANRSWDDYDMTWMEWGYEFLEMVFSAKLKASFQSFFVVIYTFIYISYFFLIKNYSFNYTLSILSYICLTFFCFDCSAIREAIAVSIFFYAIPFAQKRGIMNAIIYYLIIVFAAQIHSSAYVCFLGFFAIRYKFNLNRYFVVYCFIILALIPFRPYILSYIASESGRLISVSNFEIGLLNIFFIAVLLWSIKSRYSIENNSLSLTASNSSSKMNILLTSCDELLTARKNIFIFVQQLFFCGIAIELFSAGSKWSRVTEYFKVMIILLVPNMIEELTSKSNNILKTIYVIFIIIFFYYTSLLLNPLDIVPYQFVWEY